MGHIVKELGVHIGVRVRVRYWVRVRDWVKGRDWFRGRDWVRGMARVGHKLFRSMLIIQVLYNIFMKKHLTSLHVAIIVIWMNYKNLSGGP